MGDTFAVMRTLENAAPASAVIVGGGYIGLEMADALTVRGLAVTQMEQLDEVLPTVDPQLGAHVHAELATHGVEVLPGTTVRQISRAAAGQAGRLQVQATAADGTAVPAPPTWSWSWSEYVPRRPWRPRPGPRSVSGADRGR